MDLTTMPAWAQPALAYATVVIVALTMIANFLDWAVPRLRALAPSPGETRVLTALERLAAALTSVLSMVHRLVPRLTVIEPPGTSKTPTEDDEDPGDDGGSAPPSASLPSDHSTAPSRSPSIAPAMILPPPLPPAEPRGPYAA